MKSRFAKPLGHVGDVALIRAYQHSLCEWDWSTSFHYTKKEIITIKYKTEVMLFTSLIKCVALTPQELLVFCSCLAVKNYTHNSLRDEQTVLAES